MTRGSLFSVHLSATQAFPASFQRSGKSIFQRFTHLHKRNFASLTLLEPHTVLTQCADVRGWQRFACSPDCPQLETIPLCDLSQTQQLFLRSWGKSCGALLTPLASFASPATPRSHRKFDALSFILGDSYNSSIGLRLGDTVSHRTRPRPRLRLLPPDVPSALDSAVVLDSSCLFPPTD